MALTVGDTFQSHEEFSKRIKEFKAVNHVQLFHKDSRTLEAARKRLSKRIEKAKPSLMYFSVDLACLFGGKDYKGRGTGARQHKRYLLQTYIEFIVIIIQYFQTRLSCRD